MASATSLVVAAYRNSRRSHQSLIATARHIESAITDVFKVEAFATALICELDATCGTVTWISAGHHEPVLLRQGRLVKTLEPEPLMPLGLNELLGGRHDVTVGMEQLEPGDMVLLYTDGVVEARSPGGEFFGLERLLELLTRSLAAELPAPETMRRVTHALLDHQAGDLDDDATLLLVEWHGPVGSAAPKPCTGR